ncbi:MAG TPA: hypothetical protein VED63_05830 [Acidimicrobiales bacterium]|nr:hypothetical protein [Acidimicrobiales bacterium]
MAQACLVGSWVAGNEEEGALLEALIGSGGLLAVRRPDCGAGA